MISGNTKIVGIIGHPVEHSLSPVIQNACFKALDLDFCYLPFHLFPQDLKAGIESLRVIHNFSGLNVTIPHKETVLPLLDEVTLEAEEIGAVNTIEILEDRRLKGHNTDARGFLAAFRENIGTSLKNQSVLMVGAGGVARAVGYQLSKEGVSEIIFVNRTPSRAEVLAQQLRVWSPQLKVQVIDRDEVVLSQYLSKIDLLINATSLGLHGTDPLPIPLDGLKSTAVVCDLVYHQEGTSFLKMAKDKGFKTLDGLPMLIHQGALAFEIWTGQKAPIHIMRGAIQQGTL